MKILSRLFNKEYSQRHITQIAIISPQMYQIFKPRKNYEFPFGGAEVQLSLLARELHRQNITVHVLVADYGQPLHEVIEGIHFWKAIYLSANPFKKSFRFFLVTLRIPTKIFVRKGLTLANAVMALYLKLAGGQFIHIIAHDRETDGSHKIYKNRIKKQLTFMGLKTTSHIFTQNQYQYYNLKKRNINNTILYSLITTLSNKTPSFPNSYVLWVGRAEEWKRPNLFLELVKKMPSYQFVMICPPSKAAPQLNEYIQNASQEYTNLTFKSFVPFSEIEEYFKYATLFVNTSTQEGFPNTFIQSMKYSTPIISFSVNPNNIITTYNLGFICNDSTEKVIESITRLYKEYEYFQTLSRNCYTYVKETHDVVKNTQHFIKTIQK